MKTMNFHHFLVLDIEDAEFEFSSTQQDATTTLTSMIYKIKGRTPHTYRLMRLKMKKVGVCKPCSRRRTPRTSFEQVMRKPNFLSFLPGGFGQIRKKKNLNLCFVMF